MGRYDAEVDYLAQPDLLPPPVRVGVASKFLCFGSVSPSLVQAITKEMQGAIDVATRVGRGTTVEIYVPALESVAAPATALPAAAGNGASPESR